MHAHHGWPFLAAPHHPLLSALWELLAHGTLGLLVVLPIVWRSERRGRYALCAFAGGVALDLDHAIAAGSLSPRRMELLGDRPVTHSVLFVSALALAALAITRHALVAWAVLAVLLGHLLFDAAGGGVPLLYPVPGGAQAIPWLACPAGIAALAGISALLARRHCQTRTQSTVMLAGNTVEASGEPGQSPPTAMSRSR